MAKLVLHKLTSGIGAGSDTFYFLAPDGMYTGLAAETGVDLVTADPEKDEPRVAVKELLGRGKAIRVAARCKDGLKTKTFKILVATNLLATVLGTLPSKTVNGKTCTSVGVQRRMSFY